MLLPTSYQGGHEYFKYMYDLLQERRGQIKIFWWRWRNLPSEIAELQAYGITRIYAPDDGRHGIARYD
jgi:methylmalonyl-CoA mutase